MRKRVIAGILLALLTAGFLLLLPASDRLIPAPQQYASGTVRPSVGTSATTPRPTAPSRVPATTRPATVPTVGSTGMAQPLASYAFVYDPKADWLLFTQGDPDARVIPASLTKIFTAYIALQYLQPDTVVTVGGELALVDPHSSLAGLRRGEQLTVKMLLQGMLLPSGNDAAYVLAAAAGRALAGDDALPPQTAVACFMQAVNRQAEALGLTGTHYSVPDGIDNGAHYTTPRDLLRMAYLAMRVPLLAEICSQASAQVTAVSGWTHSWQNTNELLQPDSPYYVPDCMGMKTGYETAAGYCLLAVFPCESSYRFTLVLQSPDADSRFADTLWLYRQYLQ